MNITIVGGGNIGMCLLAEISRMKGYDVTIYASHPEQFRRPLFIEDVEKNVTLESGDYKATDSIEVAISDADVILVTLPSFLRKHFIESIEPFVRRNVVIGFFPGYGGAEFHCQRLIAMGATVFALQKVPYVARTKERGRIAGLWSKKHEILVGAIPMAALPRVKAMIEDMLWMKCVPLKNYMAATLLPGNPLLHTSGSFVYLKNYRPTDRFKHQIYYYREWNDEHSHVICSMSDEMMTICKALPIDLSEVKSIQEYYESPTPEALTKKFHTISSYHDLLLPMKHLEDGYVPDYSSRFFTEDMPYGVSTLKALSLLCGVKTPTIDALLKWYSEQTGNIYFQGDDIVAKEAAIPQLYGIDSADKLTEFYDR